MINMASAIVMTSRIIDVYVRFSRIRQVALMSNPSNAWFFGSKLVNNSKGN